MNRNLQFVILTGAFNTGSIKELNSAWLYLHNQLATGTRDSILANSQATFTGGGQTSAVSFRLLPPRDLDLSDDRQVTPQHPQAG